MFIIGELLFGIIFTLIIFSVIFYAKKKVYKNRSYEIILEKYKIYLETKSIIFSPIHPLMTGQYDPNKLCAIDEKHFIIKESEYDITDELKISYSIPFFS